MENKPRKRYHIFFFFIKKYPEEDNSWISFIQRKSQLVVLCFFLLVLGVYYHSHAQVVTSPVYGPFQSGLARGRKFNNKFPTPRTEVRHIAFLKVHKAGGSTIQNILFRHGLKRALMFIIPAKGGKFSVNRDDHEVILDPVEGDKHDVLAMHSVYNKTIFDKHLWNDSMYIAIVREPLELMISGAFYHRDRWKVGYLNEVPRDNYIGNLIRHPERYDKEQFSLTRNSMAMDFGFPCGLHVNDTELIHSHLQSLDRVFDLVLIMEHFPESLIMMKRMFNWPLSSIVYITLNDNKHQSTSELNLSDDDVSKFKKRNFLDVAIYDYFYDAFMTKLSKQGEDFYEEVKYFQHVLSKIQLYCVVTYKASKDFIVEESEWNKRFTVSPDDCDKMKTPELEFLERLREERVRELYQNML